jgi:hypothetical protein
LEERLPLLVLSGPEVHRLLGYADCVAALRSGLGALATSSAEPVLRREWISRGTHVNAVGACFPAARELDSDTVAAAALFWAAAGAGQHADF